jgi:N-acylglucosamine-6-phosphate 2-epimerase
MAAFAASVVQAGAVAIRARGAAHVRAIKAAVDAPVIGLTKRHLPPSPVYITPTWEDVEDCIAAGADIIALDATDRVRPSPLSLAEIVRRARVSTDALLMADVAHPHEGEAAAGLGFDLVSTTLAGYTETSRPTAGPDLDLISTLVQRLTVPVVAEGRITTPAHAVAALQRGAWAVCVGKAITDPCFIAGLFTQALRSPRDAAVEGGARHG